MMAWEKNLLSPTLFDGAAADADCRQSGTVGLPLYLLKNPGEETRFLAMCHRMKNLVSHLPHPGLLKRYLPFM